MNERTKTGLAILEAALFLGVLGDLLLRQTPWGLNVLLWVGVLAAVFGFLSLRRKREIWNVHTGVLHLAMIFFAAMFVWRDAIELKVLDAITILVILAVLTLPAIKVKIQIAGIFHYLMALLWAGLSAVFSPFFLFFEDIKWKTIPQKGWTKHVSAFLRGLAIATPLLIVFGALFMAADAVFQGIIEETFQINPETIFTHILLIGFLSWALSGYLRASLVGALDFNNFNKSAAVSAQNPNMKISGAPDDKDSPKSNVIKAPDERKWDWRQIDNSFLPKALTLGAVEISVILGLINLLFLSFVLVQLPYLFGGMDLVQNTPDFKLAEYARRGFGELVTVAALVLPILLFSHWFLRKDETVNEKIYRVLAGVQIALLFVIMISATQRLLLLTGNVGYGLTTVRFYPMAFMVLLALVFVWFALTVLRGARHQFAWGALWLMLFTLGTLHIMNPDDFIVRTNVRLLQEGREFDATYNLNLSDDAVPALIEGLEAMSFEDRCRVSYKLYQRDFEINEETDFRSFNFSRMIARNAIRGNPENVRVDVCPSDTKPFQSRGFD